MAPWMLLKNKVRVEICLMAFAISELGKHRVWGQIGLGIDLLTVNVISSVHTILIDIALVNQEWTFREVAKS